MEPSDLNGIRTEIRELRTVFRQDLRDSEKRLREYVGSVNTKAENALDKANKTHYTMGKMIGGLVVLNIVIILAARFVPQLLAAS